MFFNFHVRIKLVRRMKEYNCFDFLLLVSLMLINSFDSTSAFPCKTCNLEEYIDYHGNDLLYDNGGYVLFTGIQSAESCCDLCKVFEGCSFFTFKKFNGLCQLKSSAAGRKGDAWCTSGKVERTQDTVCEKKKVWIDTDLAVGMKNYGRPGYSDVDDGYAILQLFKADNIHITGISAVFGNTKIDDAYRLCKKMVDEFWDKTKYQILVHKGAGEKIDLEHVDTNDAVEAMANALRKESQTILAIGPATNVGLLLLRYPGLSSRIQEVVLVAGRRTATSYFEIGNPVIHLPDLNFELDNNAFRIIFQNGIKVVLCPFEISHKVWITAKDLDQLKNGDPGNDWLSEKSKPWLQQWVDGGDKGFNPFDVLASHYLIAPKDIVMEPLMARLEIHKNDIKLQNPTNNSTTNTNYKQYLLCDQSRGFPVVYCYNVVPDYHQRLMKSLISP